MDDEPVPVYNVGERCGPHSRGYVEVKLNQIMERAWKKNLLWILVRLHASEKQSVPSWTGFNILVRNDHEVVKDNVGYHQSSCSYGSHARTFLFQSSWLRQYPCPTC